MTKAKFLTDEYGMPASWQPKFETMIEEAKQVSFSVFKRNINTDQLRLLATFFDSGLDDSTVPQTLPQLALEELIRTWKSNWGKKICYFIEAIHEEHLNGISNDCINRDGYGDDDIDEIGETMSGLSGCMPDRSEIARTWIFLKDNDDE